MSYSFIKTGWLTVLLLGLQTGIGAADTLSAILISYREVPAVFSGATGTFTGTTTATSITYTLNYKNITGAVQQAHIHFGQPDVNGGITAFLCTNLGNGPAGTPPCAGPNNGTVTGTITPVKVVSGAATQGIAAGQIARVLKAMRDGVAYVNVHSSQWPGGEIRGLIVSTP